MGLDVRLPLGLMFAIIGLMLAAYGGLTRDSVLAGSSNINLWWGLVLLVFGGVMLWLQRRSVSTVAAPSED